MDDQRRAIKAVKLYIKQARESQKVAQTRSESEFYGVVIDDYLDKLFKLLQNND